MTQSMRSASEADTGAGKTVQYCTFQLDGALFGVEVDKVQEVIREQVMTPAPLAPEIVTGLINLRGQIVTAIDLRRRLRRPPLPEGLRPMNVVVRWEDGAVAMLVDEIGDVVEVDVSALERPPLNLPEASRALLRGVIQREDDLLLVLDVDKALEPAS